MNPSPSSLPIAAREAIAAALNDRLVDALDLHAQIKLAHWNVKGPHFPSFHPLFETFAVSLAAHADTIAERAVTLGAHILATTRHVADQSRIPAYDSNARRDLVHAQLLADRFEVFLAGCRDTRTLAAGHEDTDSADLLTAVITEFERHVWFLRASLDA